MSLAPINPLNWVRERPTQFFGSEKVDPVKLAAYLMADAITLGGGDCVIKRQDNWWAVASNFNWLSHEKYSTHELFASVVSEPKHGEHSIRAEVIVNAFSESVYVIAGGTSFQVRGQIPPEEFIAATHEGYSCVFFKIAESGSFPD